MFGKRLNVFSLFGFPIRIDLSWFVIVVLVTWSLAQSWFPSLHPDLEPFVYLWMGAAGALGLFASVLLHELGHSLVARHYGLRIDGITLFIFGGVAEMTDEPPNPKVEFLVAVAGPLVSLLLAMGCFVLGLGAQLASLPVPVFGVLSYLATINLVLVVFNVIPAFPLDGGRVLRALLWHWKDNVRQATRIASDIGSTFGLVLIVLGVLTVIRGDFVPGMWWFLIGLFLRNAARMSYQQLLLRRALEGESVERFMQTQPVTVSRSISVQELVNEYVYRYHHKMFPVVEGDKVFGCVTTKEIKALAPEEWERQSVGAIAQPCAAENSISPGSDAMSALAKMQSSGQSRLLVLEGERLVGILTLKDMLSFLALKVELEEKRQ